MPRNTEPKITNELFEYEPDEVQEALSGLPAEDCKIVLYRVKPQGRPAWIEEFSPAEFSLPMIKQQYGGGTYNIITKQPGRQSKKYRVEIEGESADTTPMTRRVDAHGRVVFVGKEVQGAAAEAARSSGSNDVLVAMLLNEVKSLKDSLQNVKPDAGHSRKEFFEEMILLKNLFVEPKQSNPIADNSKLVTDLITKGLEIGADAANGEIRGKGSWWEGIIDKLIPAVQPAIAHFIAAQNRAAGVVIPGQAVNSPNGATPLPNNSLASMLPSMDQPLNPIDPPTGFAVLAPQISPYLGLMISAASVNSDPNTYVGPVLNAVPVETLKPWLESEAWFNDLVSVDPRIQLQNGWWAELHDALIEAINTPESEEANDG